jgi:hypothetical protein
VLLPRAEIHLGLAPEYILDYLRFFVLFEDDGTLIKKIAGYHQFHAVRAAINQVVTASRLDVTGSGKGKGGVVWHTQGSGKSITMTCFAARVMRETAMENPTIVVITDRNDLDGQLFGVFSLAQDLLREQPVQAGKRIELSYISMKSAVEEERIIVPHTLVCTPMRWHVRAYCEKHRDYRDFVLSRFRGAPEIIDTSEHIAEKDVLWNTFINIQIKPDGRLGQMQQDIIARDFDMTDGCLNVKTRAPLVEYMLRAFNIDPRKLEMVPEAQQIVVANYKEIEQFLF